MAKATGLSAMTISRVWGAFGLQPHRTASHRDVQAVTRLAADCEGARHCGALHEPAGPRRVLCVHEKSQIQILRRDVHLDVIAQELTSIRVKGERAESLDHD